MPNVDLLRTNFRKGQQFTAKEAGIITSTIKAIWKSLIKLGVIDSSGISTRTPNPKKSGIGTVGFYSLSSAGGSILYGKEQTFNGSNWSDKAGALGSSEITIYPQIDNSQYHVGDKIAASSVNGFLVSLYNTPVAFDEC